jgi:hypothetical protein
MTEPELPLQSESTGAVHARQADSPEAARPTDTVDSIETSKATVDTDPKTALPMQKPTPTWTETDPPAGRPAPDEDETEPKPAVPMQKPAPSWAQPAPASAEPAGEPEPSLPPEPVRSTPLTWPPRAKADAELPTQSDIWPPEPPTEPAMEAWPPKMVDEAESQLPNLPFEPATAEWDPPAVSPRLAPESSTPQASEPSVAKTVPPAARTEPPATRTVPPAATTPPAPTVPPAATTPPADEEPPLPMVPPTPIVPPTTSAPPATPAAANEPLAPAQPGTTSHSSALPSVGTKGTWQSLASRPPAKAPPDPAASTPEDKSASKQPAEPLKPAAPDWAPTLVIPPKAAKERAADWPGVVEVPAWAPHIRVDTGQPESPTPAAEPPAPTAAKPPDPQHAAPTAGAPAPQPAAPASQGSSSWAVVEQKRIESQRITREIPSPEDRSYAEWFAWAKRGGAPAGACHAAAQAAFQALASGKDVSVAAQMAAAAMAMPPLPVDAGRQTYCAWFSLGNIDLAFDQRRAHAFATAAVHALDAGADAKGAHAAGLDAAGIK